MTARQLEQRVADYRAKLPWQNVMEWKPRHLRPVLVRLRGGHVAVATYIPERDDWDFGPCPAARVLQWAEIPTLGPRRISA
jgi:hypothetical protein